MTTEIQCFTKVVADFRRLHTFAHSRTLRAVQSVREVCETCVKSATFGNFLYMLFTQAIEAPTCENGSRRNNGE